MSKKLLFMTLALSIAMSCSTNNDTMEPNSINSKAIFLHHSTGKTLWRGGNTFVQKVKLKLGLTSAMELWFRKYNRQQGTSYQIEERAFPAKEPYGWNNYPYDYYNIWVKNGHEDYYMEEPTLKTLSKEYGVIILKHCFPVSKLKSDEENADINSDERTIQNYKLQYEALHKEFQKYPNTKFLVWTPPALTEKKSKEEWAINMKEFYHWVKNEWDKPDDNVYLWDFRELETEGGLYLLDKYAEDPSDSHPNTLIAEKAYPLFCKKIVEVINK
ncbi:hypothetical protein [Carboxylicivirga sp. RSCT41]|uniref:hypothetical protein n=1 Tax=Carboxylicivirga agarovorans TaxID=3417570 RepID=UPI003D33F494